MILKIFILVTIITLIIVSFKVVTNHTKNQQAIQQARKDGANGTNGVNGTNGTNGADGADGVSILDQPPGAKPIPGFVQNPTSMMDTMIALGLTVLGAGGLEAAAQKLAADKAKADTKAKVSDYDRVKIDADDAADARKISETKSQIADIEERQAKTKVDDADTKLKGAQDDLAKAKQNGSPSDIASAEEKVKAADNELKNSKNDLDNAQKQKAKANDDLAKAVNLDKNANDKLVDATKKLDDAKVFESNVGRKLDLATEVLKTSEDTTRFFSQSSRMGKICQGVSDTGSALKMLIMSVPESGMKALATAYQVGTGGLQILTEAAQAEKAAKIAAEIASTADDLEKAKILLSAAEKADEAAKAGNNLADAIKAADRLRDAIKAADAAASAAKAAKAAAMAAKTAVTITLSATVVFEVVSMLFDIINLIVDSEDPNGYNLLDKWKEGNAMVKAQVGEIIASLNANNTTGKEITYPSRVGPLDVLAMMPSNCKESGNAFELPICPLPTSSSSESGPIEGNNYLYKVLIPETINKFMATKSDPDIAPMYTELQNISETLTDEEYSLKVSEIVEKFTYINHDLLVKKSLKTICEKYGGIMTPGDDPVCMYNKQYCVNQAPPPPPDPNLCKLIPDPNADKCNNPPGPEKMVCEGGDLYGVAPYDVTKGWSETKQQCLSVNAAIKTICESHGLEYDIDKDICVLTEKMCLSKAGKVVKLPDGTIDCTIPIGQMIAEGIFGKTLTSVLIQTFAHNQYEECRPGYIDAGQDGLMKQLNATCADPVNNTIAGKAGKAAGGAIGTAVGGDAKLGEQVTGGLAVAYVLTGPMAATGAAVACSIGSIAKYFCRKKCEPGETDVLGVCYINNPKLNDPPCDPGYTFDNATTCNAKNVNVALTLPIPNKCPDGYKLQGFGPLCLARRCKEGDLDVGVLCREKCKDGYKDNGVGICTNDSLRPIVLPKPRKKCNVHYKFDGASVCWMDPATATRGVGIIPDQCDEDSTLVGITCWSKCGKGEVDKGATCESCPNGLSNNGATLCYKPCDSGYVYDGTKMCNFTPVTVGAGIVPSSCPSDYTYDGVSVCWKNCRSGDKDKGLLCESCDSGYENNGASLCYESCDSGYVYDGSFGCNFSPETVGAGTLPNICPDGYNNFGGVCYSRTCDSGYAYDGMMTCIRKDIPIPTATPVSTSCPSDHSNIGLLCFKGCGCIKKTLFDRTSCPSGLRNDGTSCWEDVTWSGCGCIKGKAKKENCPSGRRDDGTSCWEDVKCDPVYWDSNCNCGCAGCARGGGCRSRKCGWRGWNTCTDCDPVYWDSGCNCGCGGCARGGGNCKGCGCVKETLVQRTSCPSGQRNDGTNCWEDAKSSGCGCIKQNATKNPCPSGQRDDGTSCWEDVKTIPATISCPSDKKLLGLLCYNQCPTGYTYNDPNIPVSCIPNNTSKGLFYTQTNNKLPGCGNDQDLVTGLCYKKCPTGTSRIPGVPTNCQGSRGIHYTTKTKPVNTYGKGSEGAKCLSNRDNIGGLCYTRCPEETERAPGLPTQCQGKRGLIYPTTTAVPKIYGKTASEAKCKSNREKTDSLCYKRCDDLYGSCFKANPGAVTECMPSNGVSYIPDFTNCPSGYTDNGALMCANSYVPRTYAKNTVTANCTGDRVQISGSCYNKCPTIDDGKGGKIQLKHLDGMPTQCVPPRGLVYPALKLLYVPHTYAKKRAVEMSKK